MDMQTAITAILIILVVVLPFYYHHLKHSKHEKKFFHLLKDAAHKEGTVIKKKQMFLQSAIGLDEKQKKLFFVHVNNSTTNLSSVSLKGLKQSTVQIYTEDSKQNGSDMPGKVEMLLKFNSKDASDTTLVFYDKNSSPGSLSDEVLGARKWADYLSLTCIGNE